MQNLKTGLGNGLIDRFFWDFSFKNRKLLIPIIMVLIIVIGGILAQKFISQELLIKKLSEFEPIYVLSTTRDLNVGDIIQEKDLRAMIFSKKEFKELKYHDPKDNLDKPSLVICKIDQKSQTFDHHSRILGRIVKIPISAGSPLREEYLAPIGSLPGLHNLIPENHSLIDIELTQTGFNIYLRPGDKVDLVESINGRSRLIASDAEIILIDSQALGKAPYAVENNPNQKRNLTLVVPLSNIAEIAKAKKNQALIVTLSKKTTNIHKEILVSNTPIKVSNKKNSLNDFQALTLIQGKKKEVIAK